MDAHSAGEPAPRRSPFHQRQADLGARITSFEGWEVPSGFGDDRAGRAAARDGAAILDLSPIGRIKITGANRIDLLQRISTNDLRPLTAGHLAPTLFVTPKGRIVGRALVLDRGESLLLLVPGEGHGAVKSWIQRYVLADDFKMTDVSGESAAFALIGPRAPSILKQMTGVGAASPGAGRFLQIEAEGIEVLIAPFDALPSAWIVMAEMPGIAAVWDAAFAAGAEDGLLPIGRDDAEVLRVEAGIPAAGHELTEDWNPWEASLEGSFSLTKGCYTGQEVIARLNTYDKIQRRLAGLGLGGLDVTSLPQTLYAPVTGGAPREAGVLTSAVRSERLGETIGLGFVRVAYLEPGTELSAGESGARAEVRALPFLLPNA
jgi:folate-binding protein YgfZ